MVGPDRTLVRSHCHIIFANSIQHHPIIIINHKMSAANEPPDGVHTYTSLDKVPHDLQKYWLQRNNIFSKYDEGIWLTHDAWFGVTPEPIAKYVGHTSDRIYYG